MDVGTMAMNKGIDAYIKGKMAGLNYYRALEMDAAAKAPTNPFPFAQHPAYLEWDRGFGDGFADGGLGMARKRA
jgi:hypothetical protein